MRHVPICFLRGWRLEIQLDPGRSSWVHSQLYSSAPPSAGSWLRRTWPGLPGRQPGSWAHGAQRGRASALMGNWWNLHGSGGKIWKKPMVSMFNFDFWGFLSFFPSTNSGRYSPTSHGEVPRILPRKMWRLRPTQRCQNRGSLSKQNGRPHRKPPHAIVSIIGQRRTSISPLPSACSGPTCWTTI